MPDKTKNKATQDKRTSLDSEMKTLNKKIGDIKG
jgi:hypothetical protein